jgi:hypothetical protein
LLQGFKEAMKSSREPSRAIMACLERLITRAHAEAPAVLRAGYVQLLPLALTSLEVLSIGADISDSLTMQGLLQAVHDASSDQHGTAILCLC